MLTGDKYFFCSDLPGYEASDFGVDQAAMLKYYQLSKQTNIITYLRKKRFVNPVHPGQLSIKCVFGRGVNINFSGKNVSPDSSNYLLLNSGTSYSMEAELEDNTELFTIFFSERFEDETGKAITASHDSNLTDPWHFNENRQRFFEKLYAHDDLVTPLVMHIKNLSTKFYSNQDRIDESYRLLMQRLYMRQQETLVEIDKVDAIKNVTKLELYKRLSFVKDFIDSSYNSCISLDDMASIGLMNSSYLLLQFKKYYKITPGKYLVQKRMAEAKRLLDSHKGLSVTDVCLKVGYADPSSFSKLFKRTYNYSPENYLKQFLPR